MADLKQNYQYFLDHKKEFVEKYGGMYIVISDCSLKESFADENDAYYFGAENFGLGNFIIQLCSDNEEVCTQTFHSRVVFA